MTHFVEVEWPAIKNPVALGVLEMVRVSSKASKRNAYVVRVHATIQLINANAIYGFAPILTAPPHLNGLFEVEPAGTEETADEGGSAHMVVRSCTMQRDAPAGRYK